MLAARTWVFPISMPTKPAICLGSLDFIVDYGAARGRLEHRRQSGVGIIRVRRPGAIAGTGRPLRRVRHRPRLSIRSSERVGLRQLSEGRRLARRGGVAEVDDGVDTHARLTLAGFDDPGRVDAEQLALDRDHLAGLV